MMLRFHSALADLMVPAVSVEPDPRNANNGDTDELVASILKNGVYRPIYASATTKRIVAGHHLYAALLELGAVMVPVLWVDGDDEEAIRILLADNRIAALSRPDEAGLLDLLRLLDDTDAGLAGTGFDERELNRLAETVLSDYTDDLDLRLRGGEKLEHTITCPECHHSWVRGH